MAAKDTKNRVTLRITKSSDQKLTKECLRMGISKNAFINMILAERLKKERNPD